MTGFFNSCTRLFAAALLLGVSLGAGQPAAAETVESPASQTTTSSPASTTYRMARLVIAPKKAPEAERQRRHVVIVAVGDTGFGSHLAPVSASGGYKHGRFQTFEEALSSIAGDIDGDINFANLETVVTERNDLRAVSKAFNFRTHPDAIHYLAEIGFNLFSTANNHAFDYGQAGMLETLESLEAIGPRIVHAGIGRDLEDAAAARQIEAGGADFAFTAIGIGAPYGGAANAGANRPGQLAIHHRGNVDLMLDNLASAPADYRIVSVHSGKERLVVPLKGEIALWRDTALASGAADMVLIHHAHVARPVAMVGDRVVFFGLGNFAHFGTANMNSSGICRDFSMLARAHLVDDADGVLKLGAIEIVPIRSTHMHPERLEPAEGRRRIAVLNALATFVDAPDAIGIRFAAREDGTGLFCTELGRDGPPEVAALCRSYSQQAAEALAAELHGTGRCCLSASCATASRKVTRVMSKPSVTRRTGVKFNWFKPSRHGDSRPPRTLFHGR